MSPTIAPARPDYARQLRERDERRRQENQARFDAAVLDVARGVDLNLESVEEICRLVDAPLDNFTERVDDWQRRIDGAPLVLTAGDHQAALEAADRDLEALDADYHSKRRLIEERQKAASSGLREAQHARRFLLEDSLKLTPVAGALQRVKKQIREIEHFIEREKVRLTPEEREQVQPSVQRDERGEKHLTLTGGNSELKSEIRRREAALEHKKHVKRAKLSRLEAQRDALLALALTAVPTQEDVDRIMAGDVVVELEAADDQ